ncbi:MAG: T9SS type A sorting domain-containing protein [Candidatus Stygibacter australis]|nr:T9SS type A sorting domain-containing protein [Candidatus Stygibacter australis]
MRKAFFIVVILIGLASLLGQVEWQLDGVPVRQGVNIEWFRSAIDLPGGGCVLTWSDTRRGDRDVFAQRLDSDGNWMWGDSGVLINGEIDRQEDIVVINGAGDETIFAWVDFRNEIAGDIYAQKLDGDGNLMWDLEGVPLCLAEDIQISLNIVTDADGGAYIIWLDSRNTGGVDIYGSHILSDGSIAAGWGDDGSSIISANGAQTQHTFWEDGEGGAVCVWHDEREPTNQNLYMQRIDSEGNHLWGENGTVLCDAPTIQESGKITPDGDGGFIISWRDRRLDDGGDIFANRIDLDGNILWANDLEVYVGVGDQTNPRITEASDGGALVTWEDNRNDATYADLYAQKINLDGTIAWDAAGVAVCEEEYHQLNPRLVGDENGGCWIIWDDGRVQDHPHEDIYFQHIDGSGNAVLETNGRIVCDAFGLQSAPLIKKDVNNQIYLIWSDERTGSVGIREQLIDADGNFLLDDDENEIYYGLCGDGTNYQILGKPDSRMLFWEDTRKSVIASQIYMQVMNDDGSFGLIEDGVPITEMTGANQLNMQSELMGDNAVLVWEELRGDMIKTYTQLVDEDANHYWGDAEGMGLQLSNRDTNQHHAHLSVMGDAVYYGWSDVDQDFVNPTYQVCAQKVVNGEIQWDEDAVIVADNVGDDVLRDIVENYFIWELQTSPDFDVYVNKLDDNGEVSANWSENGIRVCGAVLHQLNPQAMMTSAGLLVMWEDLRSGVDSDIYGQIINADGETLWEDDGIPFVVQSNDQSGFQMEYYQDNIYLIWNDMRDSLDYDIYMQKYDLDGNEQWQAGGVPVAVKPGQQANPAFTFLGNTILVYWDDLVAENDINLFSQKLYLNGTLVAGWPQGGTEICAAIKNQQNPVADTDGIEYSFVIWSDFRSSGKTDIYNIYAQKLSHPDNAQDVNELDGLIDISLNNYPNPFHTGTILSFDLGRDYLEDGVVEIFNVKGQKVRTLEATTNQVYWDGCNTNGKLAATGIYMYQFSNKNFSSTVSKMILIK